MPREKEKSRKKINSTEEKSNFIYRKGIFKYVRLRSLIFLIVLFAFNSYAWFIYNTRASLSLTAHVSSWNVVFKIDSNVITEDTVIDVGRIYPGMPEFEEEITVSNLGETNASLSYEFKSITVFGTTYAVGNEYTAAELQDMIEDDFPFVIEVTVDDTDVNEDDGEGIITITVNWAFESGDDETDTYWGTQAYDYYEANGDSASSLTIELTLIATQDNS